MVSPDLVRRLADLFPGSHHVFHLDLHTEDDAVIWRYALEHELIIVSKDADFAELSMFRGFPPKVIWLRTGNCRTEDIEFILRSNYPSILHLVEDDKTGILSLFRKAAD
jgi:predicted nuclease of predicted toxin-antitoxin system